ncbi:MAG: hypothetical protein FWE37_04560 [Spirochaetaceae bacterium]|nr:hypothetical protein [Spirochaetaceae bacterium]
MNIEKDYILITDDYITYQHHFADKLQLEGFLRYQYWVRFLLIIYVGVSFINIYDSRVIIFGLVIMIACIVAGIFE